MTHLRHLDLSAHAVGLAITSDSDDAASHTLDLAVAGGASDTIVTLHFPTRERLYAALSELGGAAADGLARPHPRRRRSSALTRRRSRALTEYTS